MIIWYVIAVLAGTATVWYASERLERSSANLAAHYQLPDVIQGAVVAAVGSSFPELSSTILSAAIHDVFDIGVAAVIGSAIFNILVIPAVASITAQGLRVSRTLVFKEAQFYVISIASIFVTFSFAVIYYPVSGAFAGEVTRSIAFFPLLLYGEYLLLHYQDTDGAEREATVEHVGSEWWYFVLGLVGIVVGVEALIWATIGFGAYFDTAGFFWSLLIIAGATSFPDLFVSIKAAREGRPTVSLANVLGSNVFDLLVAIPAGVLVAGVGVIQYGRTVPTMAFLFVTTLLFLVLLRTDLELTPREAYLLLTCYALFILWVVLEATGLVALIPV